MTEIEMGEHLQVYYEQYKIAVVDCFVVECPYCGFEVRTNSTHRAICSNCNQIIQLFASHQEAEKYLNDSQKKRKLLEAD